MSSKYTSSSSRGRASYYLWYSNNVSLDLVDQNFGTTQATIPHPVVTFNEHAEALGTVVQRPRAESRVPAAGSSSNQPQPIAQQLVNPIFACEMPSSHVELGQYVTRCFLYLLGAFAQPRYVQPVTDSDSSVILERLGVPGVPRRRNVPWKTMHTVLGKASINVHNWPEGVPFPPINVEDLEEKILGKSEDAGDENVRNTRSLTQLSKIDLFLLAKAIRCEVHPLHFRVYTDGLPTGTSNATKVSRASSELAFISVD